MNGISKYFNIKYEKKGILAIKENLANFYH